MTLLDKKIYQSCRLLEQVARQTNDIELAYSGGKDSDVILELAKMAQIPFMAIYKNTTIDPPGTIKHCKDNGVKIIQPQKTFFELITQKGYPNRLVRFCCSYLKEYKIMDTCILGIRRDESTKRAARYKEPIQCRVYNKKEHVNQVLPILEWTTEDVAEFVKMRNITLHPLYYNERGELNCTKRLGCIGCPLAYDTGLSDFKKNPALVRAWLRSGDKFLKNKNGAASKAFINVYEMFARQVFFKRQNEFKIVQQGMFGRPDFKKLLEDYFKFDLTI